MRKLIVSETYKKYKKVSLSNQLTEFGGGMCYVWQWIWYEEILCTMYIPQGNCVSQETYTTPCKKRKAQIRHVLYFSLRLSGPCLQYKNWHDQSLYSKNCGKESTHLKCWIRIRSGFNESGSTTLLIVQKSRVYPPLFRSNYFHKESTLFEKSIPFFTNTALDPRKELTLWVDSQKVRLGKYYGDFF